MVEMCSSPTSSENERISKFPLIIRASLSHLHGRETNRHQEVRTPVDKNGHRHGGRPGALREELGRDHPGDGAGSHSEEHHVEEGGDHGEPPDPGDQFLESLNCIKCFPRIESQLGFCYFLNNKRGFT